MKTITIKGRDKDVYNILQENKIRVLRHGLEITGDVGFEKPSITAAKVSAENELAELRKEAKKLKIKGSHLMKTEKLKKKIAEAKTPKQKENKKAASRKTKEEKTQLNTK